MPSIGPREALQRRADADKVGVIMKLNRLSLIAVLLIVSNTPALADDVPADPAARAQAAMTALQQRLSARLLAEMDSGGPAAAVRVCRDEAQQLTAAVVAEQGIEIGRTSHRLRNLANAPRPWVAKLLPGYAGRKAGEVQPRVVDLGDRIGVVKPLPMQPLCLSCHGAPEALAPEVRHIIASAYPHDEATGFALGEVRGLIWAEVPKAAPQRP